MAKQAKHTSPFEPIEGNEPLIVNVGSSLANFVTRMVRSVSQEAGRPGRVPTLTAQKRTGFREVHLMVTADVWEAVRAYCEAIGEVSASYALRRLLRDRLVELGYLKERPS